MERRHPPQTEVIKTGQTQSAAPTPWELYRDRQKKALRDSHLVSFGERITYTFAVGNEVASIHYDQARGKIFYKGHNVSNTELEKWQIDLLHQFKTVLAESEYTDHFLAGYTSTLKKIIDRKKTR